MVNFLRSVYGVARIAAVPPANINTADSTSIAGVAKSLAVGTMAYYNGTDKAFVDLPQPYYWWECGSMIGSMLDYSHFTQDTQYDNIISKALSAQAQAPSYDLMVPAHYGDEGNDDLAVWAFAFLSAAERNFPNVDSTIPAWLTVAENAWNSLASRWDTASCGGGLLWQIFASNPNGLVYKNSVSNGGFFQISARLYRATGNETYLNWANKVWDWSTGIGFVDSDYNVYDGAGIAKDCSETNKLSFSYSHAIYLYGAAVMANSTSNSTWTDRATGLLTSSASFYSPFANATNILYEHACEQVNTCNTDMLSFKGMFSRFTYASAVLVPSLLPTVLQRQNVSVIAAANACTGGVSGAICGEKWYVGKYDDNPGLGQQMSAMEVVQGMLAQSAPAPLKGNDIKDVRRNLVATSTTASTTASTTTTSSTTKVVLSTGSSSTTVVVVSAGSSSTTVKVVPTTVSSSVTGETLPTNAVSSGTLLAATSTSVASPAAASTSSASTYQPVTSNARRLSSGAWNEMSVFMAFATAAFFTTMVWTAT